jgi:hypothetical protein
VPIDHRAAGAGLVAGTRGSTTEAGKRRAGVWRAGMCGEAYPLLPSPRMAQTQFSLRIWLAKLTLSRGTDTLLCIRYNAL